MSINKYLIIGYHFYIKNILLHKKTLKCDGIHEEITVDVVENILIKKLQNIPLELYFSKKKESSSIDILNNFIEFCFTYHKDR